MVKLLKTFIIIFYIISHSSSHPYLEYLVLMTFEFFRPELYKFDHVDILQIIIFSTGIIIFYYYRLKFRLSKVIIIPIQNA